MRRLLVLLVYVAVLFAQKESTVWQTIATNSALATTTGTARNVGQNLHQVTVLFSNAPAQDCLTSLSNAVIYLQGGFDAVNYTTFARVTTALATTDWNGLPAISIVGRGTYPQILVGVLNGDIVKCRVSVWYSASAMGQFNEVPISTAAQDNLNWNAGTQAVGSTNLAVAVAQKRVIVYQVTICGADAAGNSTGYVRGDAKHYYLQMVAFPNGRCISYPNTGKPELVFDPGQELTVETTAGVMLYHLRWQWEK